MAGGVAGVLMAAVLAVPILPSAGDAAMSKSESTCVMKLTGAGAKVVKARSKLQQSCLKGQAKGDVGSADTCIAADADGKVGDSAAKTSEADTKYCVDGSGFVPIGALRVNDAAEVQSEALLHDLLSSPVDASVETNAALAKCQQQIQKRVDRILGAKIKAYTDCVKEAVATATDLAPFLTCLQNVPAQERVQGEITKLSDAREKACAGLTLGDIFPGMCAGEPTAAAFDACVDELAECRFCLAMAQMHSLPVNCDAFDNGTADGTCATAAHICGDGSIDVGEVCDDGNNADGDCCTATCRATLPGVPEICGNGIDEDCDGADLPCACVPTGTPETTCNGVDDDCNGAIDEDYVPVTSCFKVGACAAGNVASSCSNGVETACATGTPAADDATCDGTDDDCDGATDEDYVPVTSCFGVGACAAGNEASSCHNGIETPCSTGPAAPDDATCNGVDEDCDGLTDENYVPDTSCFRTGACAAGNVASSCSNGTMTPCATGTPAADDATCNGIDDDCSGQTDEDYLPDSSCYLPGVCAAGNVASTCSDGSVTPCSTGTPAASDACEGLDDNCDGTTTMGCAALTMSTASGTGVSDGDVGSGKTITIQSRNSAGTALSIGGSSFTVTVTPPGGSATSVSVTDNLNGSYTAQYDAPNTGAYTVEVRSNGSHIQGSPFTLNLFQLINSGYVTCTGCYADLYDGSHYYCSGTYADATYYCNTDCAFPSMDVMPLSQCQTACLDRSDCHYVTWYPVSSNLGICNLHLMTTCTFSTTQSSGSIYKIR